MKKIALLCCIGMWAVSPLYGQGNGNGNGNSNNPNQNASRWDRQGNSVDTSEFIGTINQQPLKVKTGNQERMRITPDGKVGIGIWNPLEKFDVLGTIRSREDIKVDGNIFVNGTSNFYGEALFSNSVRMPGLQTASPSLTDDIIVRGEDGVLKNLQFADLVAAVYLPRLCPVDDTSWLPTWSSGPEKIYSMCANIGIYTDNPEHPLDVFGHGQFRSTLSVNNRFSVGTEPSNFARLKIKNPNSSAAIQIDQTGNTNQYNKLLFMEYSDPSTEIIHVTGPDGHIPLLIDVGGNMRVSSPTRDVFRIDANAQTVFARKIVVDEEVWPDYVFAPEYKLRTLQEVKQFIDENGHLPNVPSQETVKNEGVDLGGMVNVLLEKVEELTLYTIQQQEEIEQLKAQLKAQQAIQK